MKPEYWDRAKRALRRKDAVMSSIMQRHKGIYLVRRGEPFLTLARAIVGQQISVKAAQATTRSHTLCAGAVTPEGILLKKPSELRACGLSDRKTEYIVDLARRFAEGLVHPYRWDEMSDEEVIADLVQVRGIGRWTAEMFLIFNLLRPDIFPLDDLGLQKGIRVCYFKGRKVSLARMRKLGESWRPWRSVATWYLWRSLDPVPVEY